MGLRIRQIAAEGSVQEGKMMAFLETMKQENEEGKSVQIRRQDILEKRSDSLMVLLKRNHLVQIGVGRKSVNTEDLKQNIWVGAFIGEEESTIWYLAAVSRLVFRKMDDGDWNQTVPVETEVTLYAGWSNEMSGEITVGDWSVELEPLAWKGRLLDEYYDIENKLMPRERQLVSKRENVPGNLELALQELQAAGFRHRRTFIWDEPDETEKCVDLMEWDRAEEADRIILGISLEFVQKETAERRILDITDQWIRVEINNDSMSRIFSSLHDWRFDIFGEAAERRRLAVGEIHHQVLLQSLETKGNDILWEAMKPLINLPVTGTKEERERRTTFVREMLHRYLQDGTADESFCFSEELPWGNGTLEIWQSQEKDLAVCLYLDGRFSELVYLDSFMDISTSMGFLQRYI